MTSKLAVRFPSRYATYIELSIADIFAVLLTHVALQNGAITQKRTSPLYIQAASRIFHLLVFHLLATCNVRRSGTRRLSARSAVALRCTYQPQNKRYIVSRDSKGTMIDLILCNANDTRQNGRYYQFIKLDRLPFSKTLINLKTSRKHLKRIFAHGKYPNKP